MKKSLYFLLATVIAITFSACGGGTGTGDNSMGGGSSSMMGGSSSMGSAGSMMGGSSLMGGGMNLNSLMMMAGPMMGGGGGGNQQAPEAPKYMYLGDLNATLNGHLFAQVPH